MLLTADTFIHCESKTCHLIFVHSFGKCSAVFEILSLLDSTVNVVGKWILWILLFRHFTVDFVTMTGFRGFRFYPRDAMLARVIAIATCLSVCLSVRLSVRLSRAGIVSKRRKLAA